MVRRVFPLCAVLLLLFGMADDWLASRMADPAADLLAVADNTYVPPAAGSSAGQREAACPSPAPPCPPLPVERAPSAGDALELAARGPAPRPRLLYPLMALRR